MTGGTVVAWTIHDAWGIQAAADPFAFLAWFFVVAFWSFGSILIATQIGHVGQVAALRENYCLRP